MIKHFFSFLFSMIFLGVFSQNAETKMVPIKISYTKSNPPRCILSLEYIALASSTDIWRKELDDNTWKVLVTNLSVVDTVYTDTTFKTGIFYEYMVKRVVSGTSIYGVISAGLEILPSNKKKECLIMVDSSLNSRLSKEIDSFMELIELEGWHTRKMLSQPNQTPPQVKENIVAWKNSVSISSERSVVLIGKVPVPYSGKFAPDAHPEHVGAWPADVYYAEWNGSDWNDVSVTTTVTTTRQENKNIPGDGKFDESIIPDLVDGQLGRIYLDSLNAMGVSADSLYKRYFNKIFRYKTKSVIIPRTACIEDRLNSLGSEWPGRNVFQNAYALVGKDSTTWAPNVFLSTIKSKPFLFAQVTSTGGYTQVINVATNTQVKDSMNAVFQGYFGSYFGDWDNNNNFLRSAIAGNGLNLTSVWAGRPQWIFHQMTLGKSIGFIAKTTQNNVNMYDQGASANFVHISLMGDPTLNLHIVAPMKSLIATLINNKTEVKLAWDTVQDNIIRYYIYRSDSLKGFYAKYDSVVFGQNSYMDIKPKIGKNFYMVRAAKLESTHVGTYYNLGLGKRTSIDSVQSKPFSSIAPSVNIENKIVYSQPYLYLNSENADGPITAILLDASGSKIKMSQFNTQDTWELGALAKGIYFVQFYKEQEMIFSKKIVLNQ